MRRIAAVLAATAILMAMTMSASASIHPLVCSGNAQANGLANSARAASGDPASYDIGNPPGLTPDSPSDIDPDHADDLMAGDDNPNLRDTPFGPLSPNQFAPLFRTNPTFGEHPAWEKDCGPTP